MKSTVVFGFSVLLSLTSTALAQENQELGRMWTFESPPLAYLEEEEFIEHDRSRTLEA